VVSNFECEGAHISVWRVRQGVMTGDRDLLTIYSFQLLVPFCFGGAFVPMFTSCMLLQILSGLWLKMPQCNLECDLHLLLVDTDT
jgi:hypothetical protein